MTQIHVSELAIDRMLAGELSSADARALRDHSASCARCGSLYDDALATRAEFGAHRVPLRLPIARRRLAPAMMAGLAAMAALLAVVLAWPRSGPDPELAAATGVRAKGASFAGMFVSHGGQVRRGAATETVAPNDRIELVTTASEPAWFAAISIDATTTRSVYIPARPVELGRDQAIPMSIELDATLGREVVSAVFCTTAFDPMVIDVDAPPPGCRVDHFTLVKVGTR